MFFSFISYCINIRLKKKSNSNAIFLPIKLKKLSPVREVGGRKPHILSVVITEGEWGGHYWHSLQQKSNTAFPKFAPFKIFHREKFPLVQMNYEKCCLHQWTCNARELGPVHIECTRERISKKVY